MKLSRITLSCAVLSVLALSCATGKPVSRENRYPGVNYTNGAVTITSTPRYYVVEIDKRGSRYSDYEIGQQYGEALMKAVPNWNDRIGLYLTEAALVTKIYFNNEVPDRIYKIKANMRQEYIDEIEGMATKVAGYGQWKPLTMMWFYSLMPDILRVTGCAGYGVNPPKSETGQTIAFRTLDWGGGYNFGYGDLLSDLQAVTKILYDDRTIYLFGALGNLGCVTGVNSTTRVFGAILDSPVTSEPYSADGRRSYYYDLRYALESGKTSGDVAAFMKDASRTYTYNHLIMLADRNEVTFLENNISMKGEAPSRELRRHDSPMNPWIEWPWTGDNIIAAVNSFNLAGQVDNFNDSHNYNPKRWVLLTSRTLNAFIKGDQKLNYKEVRDIMCSFWGSDPVAHGDLYGTTSQQMFVYIPETNFMQIYMKPRNGATPRRPNEEFFTFVFDN